MNESEYTPQHVVILCLLIIIQCLCEAHLWGAVREGCRPGRREKSFTIKELKYNEFSSILKQCACRQTSVDFIGDKGLSGAAALLLVGMYETR